MKKLFLFLVILFAIYSCQIHYSVAYNSCDIVAQSKDLNVCKQLKDSAIIYAIFVDAKNFHPWTEFAVNSTLDSLKKATDWIQSQAKLAGRDLKIKTIQHIDGNKISFQERRTGTYFALEKNLTFSQTKKTNKKFNSRLNHWSDQVAKYVGKKIKMNSTNTGTRMKIKSMENLILALQDEYKSDNISVMIFVNGFFHSLSSATYNSGYNGLKPEYSIITDKNPATLAHEYLHLYGAVDLYPNQNFPNFNYKEIEEIFPNEIMRITHKNIDKLMLSPITKYYIGWQPNLDKANTRLLYHKARVLEY